MTSLLYLLALTCYTNLAGRTIFATPVKVDGATATFDCGTRGTRTLSLDIFPASERRRIKRAVGVRELPACLKNLAEEIAAQRKRAEARAKAGRMTPAKLDEYRENLAASWRHAVDEAKLSADEAEYWKTHLP